MLIAIWRIWVERRQWWWLALLGAILIADVAIGSWLISWEITHAREWMP